MKGFRDLQVSRYHLPPLTGPPSLTVAINESALRVANLNYKPNEIVFPAAMMKL